MVQRATGTIRLHAEDVRRGGRVWAKYNCENCHTLLGEGAYYAPDLTQIVQQRGVPYLERVIDCNLTRLSRLLRILRFHAHDLNLKPSATAYMRYGKGPKQRLRFSKTGDAGIEAAYSTHFVWPGKRPFHSVRTEPTTPTDAV